MPSMRIYELWSYAKWRAAAVPDLDWNLGERQEWAAGVAARLLWWAFSGSRMRYAMVLAELRDSGELDVANVETLRSICSAVADECERRDIHPFEPALAGYVVVTPDGECHEVNHECSG